MAQHYGKFFKGNSGSQDKIHQLFVEGIDDAYFFDKLLDDIGANNSIVGINCMGNNDVKTYLQTLSKQRNIISGDVKKIAFAIDSDEDPDKTNRMIKSSFKSNSFEVHNSNEFFSCNGGKIHVGYTLMPSDLEKGNLEYVCLRTLGDDNKLAMVTKFLKCIERKFGVLTKTYKRQTAIYLACAPCETRGVGKSFSDGLFNHAHESLADIKLFLQKFIDHTE